MPWSRPFRCLVIAGALAGVAACASSERPTAPGSGAGPAVTASETNPYGAATPHRKVGNPYKVAGIWYYPQPDPDYDAEGIASWYGPKFHGRKTANGEIFDMNRVTAAHPTLPLPSVVRVTNLENGRAINLRLNDRGPFAHGRVIDLSRAAAEQLGYREQGLARVRVQYLGDASLNDAILALGEPEAYATGRLAMATPEAGRQASLQYDTVKTRIATGPEITVDQPLASARELTSAHIGDAREAVVKAEEMVVETPVAPGGIADAGTLAPPAASARPVTITPTRTPDRDPVREATVADTPADRSPAVTASPETYVVQVGAFSVQENADRTVEKFADQIPVRTLREERGDGNYLYMVRLGPFASLSAADNARAQAIRRGFSDARIVQY